MSERADRQAIRLKSIIDEVQRRGEVSINGLCEQFQASTATIRRDLQQLEEQGLLRRTHGGAVSIEPLFYEAFRKDASYVELVGKHTEEKRRIGRAAAELVRPGDLIALTPGTTTIEVIRGLRYEGGIKVLTNTVNVAMELSNRKDIEVIVTGGHLRGDWFSLVGPLTLQNLSDIHVDIVFVGANGIHPTAGLTCHNAEEAATNRAMLGHAKRRIGVLDRSKFDVITSWSMCRVQDLDMVITDKRASKEVLAPYEELGLRIERV